MTPGSGFPTWAAEEERLDLAAFGLLAGTALGMRVLGLLRTNCVGVAIAIYLPRSRLGRDVLGSISAGDEVGAPKSLGVVEHRDDRRCQAEDANFGRFRYR
jgi:hypothetical protein